jgi:hypothetical protein
MLQLSLGLEKVNDLALGGEICPGYALTDALAVRADGPFALVGPLTK